LPAVRPASATPPDTQSAADAQAVTVVEQQLVKPLAAKEARRNRFSRGYIPPDARRVRVLDRQRWTDARGGQFVTFVVDERSGLLPRRAANDSAGWRPAIFGCVYPARSEVFIQRSDRFFGVGLLLGHKTAAADAAVCRPAAKQS
jgi:hypothetical protein